MVALLQRKYPWGRPHHRKTRPGWASILLMLALILFEGSSKAADEQNSAIAPNKSEVLVKANNELKEISYTISQGECKITWTLYISGINRGVLTHHSKCRAPLQDQTVLMEDLLDRILTDHPDPDALHSLYWGRIAPDFTGCTDISSRLSMAAAQSTLWNRRNGRPFQGHPNQFVASTIEQQHIHSELVDLFKRYGRQLKVSDVEKVLVAKLQDLPCHPFFISPVVRPEDKLPFDCQLWFVVQPVAADPGASKQ